MASARRYFRASAWVGSTTTRRVASVQVGSPAALAAAWFALARYFASYFLFSSIHRASPRANAASPPGLTGTQRWASAAVLEKRGSTTTYFPPLARKSISLRPRATKGKFASRKLEPNSMMYLASKMSGLKWFLRPRLAFSSQVISSLATWWEVSQMLVWSSRRLTVPNPLPQMRSVKPPSMVRHGEYRHWLAMGPSSGAAGSMRVLRSRSGLSLAAISWKACSHVMAFHWPEPRGPTRFNGCLIRYGS